MKQRNDDDDEEDGGGDDYCIVDNETEVDNNDVDDEKDSNDYCDIRSTYSYRSIVFQLFSYLLQIGSDTRTAISNRSVYLNCIRFTTDRIRVMFGQF